MVSILVLQRLLMKNLESGKKEEIGFSPHKHLVLFNFISNKRTGANSLLVEKLVCLYLCKHILMGNKSKVLC